MSGAEHLDIAPAHLKGINESVACANLHVERSREDPSIRSENDQSVPSVCFESLGGRDPGYADRVVSQANEDGVTITDRDVGKCLGNSLNATESAGEGLGMLEDKGQACESDGMGSRISNFSAAQQSGDGLIPGRMTSEPAEDVSRTSVCGNGASTCKNDEILGEKLRPGKIDRTCVAVEDGNQISIISSTPCHERNICDPSRLENRIGLDPSKSELPNVDADKTNSIVPELVSASSIHIENAVGLHCKLNLQNKSADLGADLSSFAQSGSCGPTLSSNPTTGYQQYGFGHLSLCNQRAEEKIGTQSQNDPTARGNTAEGSSENNYGSGCVDDQLDKSLQATDMVLECASHERVANSSKLEKTPEALREHIHGSRNSEGSEERAETASEAAPDNMKVEQTAESNIGVNESSPDRMKVGILDLLESSDGIEKTKPATSDVKGCPKGAAGSLSEELTGKPRIVVIGCPANGSSEIPKRGRRSGKFSAVTTRNKYLQRSSVDSTRALRPRSQDNPEVPEPNSNLENRKGSTGKRRGRRKKSEIEGKSYDEFSRMRKHLRYLLHRIRYEQNLLDAYSSEGWRGQSLEKLRPEKELQRAKADISRSKLKIRDLFQRLDSMSSEGKFPDSLFDSEGLIDSEDIFCAKCGSKELSADNDIILCDGACDRGFHQFCLEPPLQTEEIPPGDEGWLCPACDCKVDCIELLNDSQGTKLSVGDSWEKVFPEAAASLTGNELDDIMGLPSDDSGDNDYNPDGTDDDAKVEGSASSSDGSDSSESDSSDFSSVSEDLADIGGDEQYLGLPSDDSEDGDYDPSATNINEDVEQESSGSDFTSASEDLDAAVRNDRTSGDDEPPAPLLGPDQDTADSLPLSGGRRHVERLDYKKLYDETYGNASPDSSDDEEWTDMVSASKRKGSTEKGVPDPSNGNVLASADGSCSTGAPRRRGRKKRNPQAVNGPPAQLVKSSEETSSCDRSTKRPHNRLGEAVTRRLYESFKENQYPDRLMKEKLANELGLTPKRVDKWFGNARWSFNHHRGRMEASMAAAASHSTPHVIENASADTNAATSEHGSADSSKLDANESSKSTPTPNTSKKRKSIEGPQPMPQSLNSETSEGGAQTDSLRTPVAEHGSIRKRRKSTS